MKKQLYLLALLFLLALSACNDFHDNIQPADDLPIVSVYKSATDLESALNGVYNSLQSVNLAGTGLFLIPELMGGNGSFSIGGFPHELDLANRTLGANNIDATNFWTEAYNAINLANAILAALPQVEDAVLTLEVRNRIEGEALFIRGFLHFELVRYFGQPFGDSSPEGGVPILTEAVLQKGDLTFPARASVNEVYAQATADLTKARDLLPLYPYDRANHQAAVALLARIAFQKADYLKAAILTESLVENGVYSLTITPADFFDNNKKKSEEIIWAVRYSPTDPMGLEFWFGINPGNTSISEDLKAAFDSVVTPAQKAAAQAEELSIVDLRFNPPLIATNGVDTFTNKYEDNETRADDAPMARLAEFILMRAEALARAGDLPGAIDLLNQVRGRSLRVQDANSNEPQDKQHLVLFTENELTQDELIEAIILERRVELCFEGNYFQDMIRLHRSIGGLAYDDCRLRLPIPQRERDVNPNLKQNEPCY